MVLLGPDNHTLMMQKIALSREYIFVVLYIMEQHSNKQLIQVAGNTQRFKFHLPHECACRVLSILTCIIVY